MSLPQMFIMRFALPVVIGAIVALAATHSLFSPSPLTIALQLLAVTVAVWARRSFPAGAFRVAADPAAETVIRRGPYRFIRHPMYSAALLFIWTAVLSHRSMRNVVIGLVVTGTVAARIVLEERLLRARYSDYAAYEGTTKAVVPYVL